MIRALTDEPLPMPPITVLPPDAQGNCPDTYSKQADGSCHAPWISGFSNTTVIIAAGALVFLFLMMKSR